jgi:hypothetical protein
MLSIAIATIVTLSALPGETGNAPPAPEIQPPADMSGRRTWSGRTIRTCRRHGGCCSVRPGCE